jgi:hypothetical protein
LEASLFTTTKYRKFHPSHFSMPSKRDTIKARDLQTKARVRVVEWETRMYSRQMRDVPVEVSDSDGESPPKAKKRPKRAARRSRAESSNALQGGTNPQPMEVDETFWAEEPVMPTSEKKVRRSTIHMLLPRKPHTSHRFRTPTLRILSLRLALTYAASLILREFR